MRETCYHCAHADFKAESESTMRGFAKCGKARNTEERAKYTSAATSAIKVSLKPRRRQRWQNGKTNLKNGERKNDENLY